MLCRILLVDDDPNILAALRRELLRPPVIGTDAMEIEGFQFPREALARAAESDASFDAVIVDYRMPQLDGIQFLEQFRQRQPLAVRILLTGEIGLDGAIYAIKNAQVDHLLLKPWHEYDLKSRIALAIHEREMMRAVKVGARNTAGTTEIPLSPEDHILLIDDESPVINALRRDLLHLGHAQADGTPPLKIEGTTSVDEAIATCEATCPQLIIADYQMPGMDGITLLHQLRKTCPYSIRVLISGRADTRVLLDAINIAGIHHFLAKPWTLAELKTLLVEVRRYRDLLLKLRPQ